VAAGAPVSFNTLMEILMNLSADEDTRASVESRGQLSTRRSHRGLNFPHYIGAAEELGKRLN
jgi:hypothetical protein